jgi:hypothetical protein
MGTHVKVVAWLWIAWAVVSTLTTIGGVPLLNANIPGARDARLVTSGLICFALPGIIGSIAAGVGLLKYKNWARILAIILAIVYMLAIPLGTAVGIYTLIIMFNKETAALFRGEATPAEA